MKGFSFIAALLSFIACLRLQAQQPVRYELIKIAETVILPPSTPAEAYQKSLNQGQIDNTKLFGSFYDRMEKIGRELQSATGKQKEQSKRDKDAANKLYSDDFGKMTTSQQAQYLKEHPEVQQTTGVSASMMEFAAKMEDPAFKKKFDAMSNEEKAKLFSEYQKPFVKLMQETHTQNRLTATVEAARLVNKFNENYHLGGLGNFQKDRIKKEKTLDEKEQEDLAPVMAEKVKLLRTVGAGMTAAESQRLKEVTAAEWTIRVKTIEKKLALYRSEVTRLIISFKLAAKPFDDFLAKINYGDNLKESNEARDLAQLAGYQEGLFNEIATIQALAKDITLQAARIHSEYLAATKGK